MLFIAILPAVGTVISWKRGILVSAKRTPAITRSVMVNLIVLGVLLVVLGYTLPADGVLLAAMAYAGSVVAEWVYLHFESSRVTRVLYPDR